jgi:AraC-like DNA-binding protein
VRSPVERLAKERRSVGEIAEELGYSDPAHFTRFFRRRAGVPPSAYREEIERAQELARGACVLPRHTHRGGQGRRRARREDRPGPI